MPSFVPLPNAELRTLNTLGLAAHAAWFAQVHSLQALREALAWAEGQVLPCFILGGGSNVVFAADWPGLVVQTALPGRDYLGIVDGCHRIRLAAGENWHQAVCWTVENGWPGLENLALIPGQVGAAPIQNIGAYGIEIAEHIVALEVLDRRDGSLQRMEAAACHFGYRDSVFKHGAGRDLIITALELALPLDWRPRIGYRDVSEALGSRAAAASAQEILAAVVAIRQRKLPDPAQLGNVGSFFKNPVVDAAQHAALAARHPGLVAYAQADGRFKLAAAWLIDQAGWRGRRQGAAGVHRAQALVLVNHGGASGAEILALASAIQADIERNFGVALEIEPQLITPTNTPPARFSPATSPG